MSLRPFIKCAVRVTPPPGSRNDLQGDNGWGQRSCASRFSQDKADRLAKEWATALHLPAGRMGVEPEPADDPGSQGSLFGGTP